MALRNVPLSICVKPHMLFITQQLRCAASQYFALMHSWPKFGVLRWQDAYGFVQFVDICQKYYFFSLIIITLALDNIYRTVKQEKFGFKERFSSGLNL